MDRRDNKNLEKIFKAEGFHKVSRLRVLWMRLLWLWDPWWHNILPRI